MPRTPYTEHHSERVALYSLAIAEELRFPQKDKEAIKLAATLHDIGKIGVPDSVLKKPGKLTTEEYNEMKLHPVKGARRTDDREQKTDLFLFRLYFSLSVFSFQL